MKTAMREKLWAKKYPEVGTGPVPTEPMFSEEHFALERDRIFRRTWINVGRVEDLPEPGDYFVRDISVCGVSLLIMRGSDGIVRGFHNVCSHRGKKLVLDERGSCRDSVVCPFHSWVYSNAGELRHVPDEENFFDLDKRTLGLTPVHTDTGEGFVFCHLDSEPGETLRQYLGGLADQLEGCQFGRMKLTSTHNVNVHANWKVVQDGQNEAYHFPFQHRRVLAGSFMRNEKGHCRYQDVNLYNYHSVWSCEYPPTQKLTPLRIALAADAFRTPLFHPPQMIGKMDHFVVFPNFVILLVQIGRTSCYVTYNLWPLAVDRTIWEVRMHFTEPQSVRERLRQEYFKCITLDTLREDMVAHESVYAGLATGAKSHVILQDDEITLRFFHKTVEDHVGFYRDGMPGDSAVG